MPRGILIIEHNRREADGFVRYLNEYGYIAEVCGRGDEGIRAFKENLHDLIFIDLVMPDMPGIEICKRIKSYEDGIRTPVYFLSPLASGHDLARRSNGALGTLTKPVNLGDLLSIAEKHLGPGDATAVRQFHEQRARARREDPSLETAPPRERSLEGESRSGRPSGRTASPPTAGEPKPSESGRVEKTGMPALLARLAREGFSGRLEMLTTERHCAIRFTEGIVVGLTSGDFLPYLIRSGRLSEKEAEGLRDLRRRRRADILDVLRAEKTLGSADVDLLVDRWRAEALREAALTTTGEYRLFPGEVEGTIHMEPLILIHHHLKTLGADGVSGVEPPVDDAPFRPADLGDRRAASADPDLALILHAAESGATPAQIRGIMPDPKAADSGIMALWLAGYIRQDPSERAAAPAAAPDDIAMPEAPDVPFDDTPLPPPESDFDFDGFDDEFFPKEPDRPDETLREDEPESVLPTIDEPTDETFADFARLLDDGPDEDFDVDFEGLADSYATRPIGRPRPTRSVPPRGAPAAPFEDFDHSDETDLSAGPAEPSSAEPLSTQEILRRADQLMKSKTYSRAQEYYEEVVLRKSDDCEAWTKLARAIYRNRFEEKLSRTIEAVRACRKAIALKPDFLHAYVTLDKIFDEETKFDIARGVILQALSFSPQDESLNKRLRSLERRIQRRS